MFKRQTGVALLLATGILASCGDGEDPRKGGEAPDRETARQEKGALGRFVGSTQSAYDADCMNDLKTLGWQLPADGKEILRGKTLNGADVAYVLFEGSQTAPDPRFLCCSAVRGQNGEPTPEQIQAHDPAGTDYEGPVGLRVMGNLFREPATTPILWDKGGNHEGYRHVLFMNGQVEEVANKDFQARVLDVVEALRTGE